jgi:tRNA threonylcarbamoyladenosine biosynthesis protein TsaE
MKYEISTSERQTKDLAGNLARKTASPKIICLYGDLGSGKTIFVKGFAEGLGFDGKSIKSPTYTFLQTHKLKKKTLHHFDFYRVEEADDIMRHDLQEIFEQNAYFLIEWPDRIKRLLPKDRINVKLEYIDPNTRKITVL